MRSLQDPNVIFAGDLLPPLYASHCVVVVATEVLAELSSVYRSLGRIVPADQRQRCHLRVECVEKAPPLAEKIFGSLEIPSLNRQALLPELLEPGALFGRIVDFDSCLDPVSLRGSLQPEAVDGGVRGPDHRPMLTDVDFGVNAA